MKDHHTRMLGRLALMAAAAATAAPVAAAQSGGPTARNDIAHFGTPSREHANATARNDKAHFGTNQRSSAAKTSPVERQAPAPIIVRVDGGFDWVSAGVGAAGGFGLVLVAGATASAIRRRQRVDVAQA
jgi:hypothetical protein